MRYWTREVAGWVLVALGLYCFYQAYALLRQETHPILEGAAVTLMGIIIFRGGIHLLKVAIAAQVCLETTDRGQPIRATSPRVALGKRPISSGPVRR